MENTYINLPRIFYSYQKPDKVKSPNIIIFNEDLAKTFNVSYLKDEKILSGNEIIEGSRPIAEAYAGHQFGHFTMLGDGRAILLGEIPDNNNNLYDIQLKGAGKTKYSRGGDGKAALGPMLREYIISEAMAALGIETTRSLAVVTTGERIFRSKDGLILQEKGAINARIAKSHIRVGTFQFASKYGTINDLKALADYTIKRHYKKAFKSNNPYLELLKEVIKGQGKLIAKWQQVGFVHGVLNTDNVSIACETIDYGPCAFMDTYNLNTVFSSIDINGRYSYKNQPEITMWNLARFAETLIPLISSNKEEAIKLAEEAIGDFSIQYEENYYNGMRKKIGLYNRENNDKILIEELLEIIKQQSLDYTNSFKLLTENNLEFLKDNIWINKWNERLKRQPQSKEEIKDLMDKNNPVIIPRNHLVEEALNKANENDYTFFNKLLLALKSPFDYTKDYGDYVKVPKEGKIAYKTYCGT